MDNVVGKLRGAVNLDGYGSSSGFFGYFEKDGKGNFSDAEFAVSYFVKYFKNSIDGLRIISSLHVNIDELMHCSEDGSVNCEVVILQRLLDVGLINALSYKESFGDDFDSLYYLQGIDLVWSALSVYDASILPVSDFSSLMVAKMFVFGIYGHFFIVDEKSGLAFYPHDYLGYGVIDIGAGEGRAEAEKFLRGVGQGWRFFIEGKHGRLG